VKSKHKIRRQHLVKNAWFELLLGRATKPTSIELFQSSNLRTPLAVAITQVSDMPWRIPANEKAITTWASLHEGL